MTVSIWNQVVPAMHQNGRPAHPVRRPGCDLQLQSLSEHRLHGAWMAQWLQERRTVQRRADDNSVLTQTTSVLATQLPATFLSTAGATDRLHSCGHPSHWQICKGFAQGFQQKQRIDASIPFGEQPPMGDAGPDALQLVRLNKGESAR